MSNFTAFNKDYVESIVGPFIPGAAANVTPIKFQTLTPDVFAFMFRTTGTDGTDYFFVSLEFDVLPGAFAAEEMIREWAGVELQQLFMPDGVEVVQNASLEQLRVPTHGPYYAILALIDKPKDLGYWSDHVVLRPGDNLREKLVGFSDEHIKSVQKMVGELSEPKVKSPKTNTSPRNISVFRNGQGGVEFFYQ